MPLELPSTDPKPLAPGLYMTDAFHRKPLFVVNRQVVSSWNEAHALHGPARLEDVNPAYLAALISGNPNAGVSPYKRIRRLPRAHHIRVGSDDTVQTHCYDPLAGGAGSMEQGALHQYLRQGLIDHLQRTLEGHAGFIGCEHSSGLDSNAILGGLVHGVGVDPERIHTWSIEEGGEAAPLRAYRPFHRLNPKQCHRLERSQAGCGPSLAFNQQQLSVFGAPAQIGGNPNAMALLKQHGCTVLFSGFGGDQALSHHAANVPTDLVAQGRWHELRQWMGGTRVTLRTAVGRVLALRYRPWAVKRVLRRTRECCNSDLLTRTLTPKGSEWLGLHLNTRYPWEFDNYIHQHHSIRQRVLADWVAIRAEEETRLAAFHGLSKSFPLLDEKLISALLQQDPALFGDGTGYGRLLFRRAFAGFLPPFLRDNPTKRRAGFEQRLTKMMHQQKLELEFSASTICEWHSDLSTFWDIEAIRRETDDVLSSSEPTIKAVVGTNRALANMSALNSWWQALDR